jgi:hypothetical protein
VAPDLEHEIRSEATAATLPSSLSCREKSLDLNYIHQLVAEIEGSAHGLDGGF